MPKQTFLNLPEEKRRNIASAAIEEFAEFGFEASSINRIVANSGISKGSFYQYFEDKMDVFKYLMDVIAKEKTEYYKGKHPPSANLGTFEYFHWLIKTGMEFNSSYPRLVQAISRVLLAEGLYYGKDLAEYHKMSTDGITMMIKQAMENGELDPSVDVELAVIIMETWTNAISTYILNEGMKQKDVMKWLRSAKTREKIDKMLYVMEYGLRKTESQFVAGI
ncbi:MAG: TetR/AcrR family transcriptional regulator [Chloroflexi bacterium]|nr:TetR/AcrR family transcriptional regulator [Chloroflexota bacterium]